MTRLEFWLLLAGSGGLAIWYAKPQLFYALYSLYEMVGLIFPGVLPPLGSAT
ncbi:MAG: hypothetical protein ACRDHG_12475 [Anaerolineales bacterium]